jgi:hypothetical protein
MSKLSQAAQNIALSLWQEQLDMGYGQSDEVASIQQLDEWLGNRTYSEALLERAASGDTKAVIEVRNEAGLPVFR